MQTIPYTNSTMGAEVITQVPATVADLIAASSEADVHNAAVKHSFYQGWNNKFRKAICAKLEEVTGQKRRQQMKGGEPVFRTNRAGEQIPVLESEQTYVNYVRSEGYISEADYLVLCQQVADGIPFEVSKAEEEKAPAKEFVALAKQIMGMAEAGQTTPETFAQKFESNNPGRSLEALGGFTEEGIARALEIDDTRRKQSLPAHLV